MKEIDILTLQFSILIFFFSFFKIKAIKKSQELKKLNFNINRKYKIRNLKYSIEILPKYKSLEFILLLKASYLSNLFQLIIFI